jgi:hypothetical protein
MIWILCTVIIFCKSVGDCTPRPQKLIDSILLNMMHTTSWLTYKC